MRLYLNAESKNHIGYTPDWLKVTYEENRQIYDLTLDIQGSIEYDKNTLACRCKGDLIPWTLHNLETGDEIDLYELPKENIEAMFPNKKIAEIIRNSKDRTIGIYPINDAFEEIMTDVLSDCNGFLEMFVNESYCYIGEFKFNVEINI